jgi:hypothetical protein
MWHERRHGRPFRSSRRNSLSGMHTATLKRRLLISLMVALSTAALLAIAIFVVGGPGETEGRLLATTLVVAFFCLTGLCAAIAVERRRSPAIGVAGMMSSASAALLAIVVIWSEVTDLLFGETLLLRLAFASGIAAVALAWCSLALLSSRLYSLTRIVNRVTVALILILAAIIDVLVVAELNLPAGFGRFLGVLGVLAILGTFLAPILAKVLSLEESTKQDQAVPPPAA